MEVKKSPKADLENKKGIFFEVGLVLALAVLLFAFEWKTSAEEVGGLDIPQEEQIEEEIIPVTMQQKAPPPPPPPAPKLTDLIDIVEDETMIDEELEIIDVEDESENVDVEMDFEGDFGDEDTGESEIFQVVEKMPKFPHGNVQAWLAKKVKYPAIAAEMGIQGKVYIQFVIEKDGSITDVKVLRGIDKSLDQEAVRVVKSMPKWTPGEQRGKPVRVYYTLPINFRLEGY